MQQSLTKYQVSYACECEDGRCEITMKKDEGVRHPPVVCLLGKNVSHVLENGCPRWELKGERFKRDEQDS